MGKLNRKKHHNEIYLVNVTILEGRHFAWPNMDSYVHTRIGNQTKCTKVRIGTDAPFYNEYYVFEFSTQRETLLDKNLTLTVFRPGKIWRRKKCLGYITVDVATIWEQPDHQFFRKWAVLCSPGSDFNGPRGYLKVTVSILAKGESPIIPVVDPLADDDIEGNLLLPDGITLERQRCQYVFKVYHADDLSKGSRTIKNLKKHEKGIKKAYVQVSFAGLTAKTAKRKHSTNVIWNEALILHELFPPLCQRVKVVLNFRDAHNRVRSVKYINIHSIANDKEQGFLPTFGPAYIYFYTPDECGEGYAGRVLLSFETKLSGDNDHAPKGIMKEKVASINELEFWKREEVLLFATVFDVTLINKKYTGKPISFDMLFGNPYNRKEELIEGAPVLTTPAKKPVSRTKQFWYLSYEEQKPCLRISVKYPDFRRRLYNSNMISSIVVELKQHLDAIEQLFVREEFKFYNSDLDDMMIEMFEFLSAACRKYIDIATAHGDNFITTLDREKTKLCLREMQDIEQLARTIYNPRLKKKCFRKAQKMYRRLDQLIDHPQSCWPDIFIWMKQGVKKVACEKIEAKDIVFAIVPEEKGKYCGKIHNIYFKTNKKQKHTSPIACKLTILLWLGLQRHKDHCIAAIPEGYTFPGHTDATHIIPDAIQVYEKHKFQCRAHIYQGRFEQSYDDTGLSDYYCRISVEEQCLQTRIVKATLNPVWDQCLHFQCFTIFGTEKQIKESPPIIVLEVCDQDNCCTSEYAGRGTFKPVVKLLDDEYIPPHFPPKLKWVDIKNETGTAGQVLAAIELLELDSKTEVVDTRQTKEVIPIPSDIKPLLVNYRMEVFFWGVRQLKKADGLPIIRPRIALECSGEQLRSETLNNARRYLNFEEPIKFMDFQLSSLEEFIPPIMIKMYECRSFGRNIYLGCCLVYAQQFLYHPISEAEYGLRISGFQKQSFDSFDSKAASIDKIMKNTDLSGAGDANQPDISTIIVHPSLQEIKSSFTNPSESLVKDCPCKQEYCDCPKIRKSPLVLANPKTSNISSTKIPSEKIVNKLGSTHNMEKKGEQGTQLTALFDLARRHSTASVTIDYHDELKDLPTDWWAKYYASTEDTEKSHKKSLRPNFKLKIYNNELEKQPEFYWIRNYVQSFGVYKGKRTGDDTLDQQFRRGLVKCSIKLYRWPPENNIQMVSPTGLPLANGYFQHYPSNEAKGFLLRLYCVKGVKLRPLDASGKCDSFICVIMNDTKIKDTKNYIAKDINPIYGRYFELKGTFPKDNKLTIQVWDWDRASKNDLIGETEIDIENRFYSTHRANCGLQYEYTQDTPCFWRDQFLPSRILEDKCFELNLPPPVYNENSVHIGYNVITNTLEPGQIVDKENVALYVLHHWKEVPVVGCDLVPEHVETRSLFHPAKPGLEQGKLQMWIDIFSLGDNPPPKPVDISPRKPQPHELRIIIHNTDEVLLKDDDWFLGEKKSDIYVKAWLHEPHKAQCTDIHYRSLTGEGNFNWRFVFPFHYLPSENKIVHMEKSLFSIDEAEIKVPCKLKLQVWDNDTFSPDDFIGFLTMDLTRIFRGSKSKKKCTLKIIESDAPTLNLFKLKRTKGWWPMKTVDKVTNNVILAGKLEAEFHLLTKDEADADPVGHGRNNPQGLPPPNRPNTSFQWFRNPLKSFRYILCRHYKWNLFIFLTTAFLVLFIMLFLDAFPGYTVKKLLRA